MYLQQSIIYAPHTILNSLGLNWCEVGAVGACVRLSLSALEVELVGVGIGVGEPLGR